MRLVFDDMNKQMMYISRFFTQFTNLEKKCQLCGKPTTITHNSVDPYKIQLICPKCRKEHSYNIKGIVEELPLIDLTNYITNDRIRNSFNIINGNSLNKIDLILKSKNYTRQQAYKLFNGSKTNLEKTINIYEQKVDKNVRKKLEAIFNQSRNKVVRAARQKATMPDANNNISKIKYEKSVSNKKLAELTNYQIKPLALSMICTGKTKPKIKTKCVLAEALNVTIADLFPEDYLYNNVHNFEDLINFQNSIRNKLTKFLSNNKYTPFMTKNELIEDNLKMSIYKYYRFMKDKALLSHNEIVNILDFLDKYDA